MTTSTILTALWVYVVASFILMLAVKVWARVTGRRCRPVGTLNCIGVGLFIDPAHGRASLFLLPFIGLLVDLDTYGTIVARRLEEVCDRQPAA